MCGPLKCSVTAAVVIVFLSIVAAAPDYDAELYEGSPCRMEDGSEGVCKELPQCPKRIEEVRNGKRFSTSSGRCSFKNFVEIVCCPKEKSRVNNDVSEKLGLRPADVACHEYENEIIGEDGEKVNTNIFNGERAGVGEFPYMVALGYRGDKNDMSVIRYQCGGTLISFKHVLTAAHCVNNINNFIPVVVRLGTTDLNDNSDRAQLVQVVEVVSHPKYKRSLKYYDIAILKLRRSINISQTVMPICLQTKPIPNLQSLLNMSLIVTGWGATSFENEGTNNLQKTPSLELINRVECNALYKGFSNLPNGLDDSMICVLDKNMSRHADACQGDSGGPLLLLSSVSSTVVGVTSFGQSCGSTIPAIYTSVIYYLDWIEDKVWPEQKRPERAVLSS